MSDAIDVGTGISKEERLWAMLCHLGTFATFIPFCNIVVPLIIWMIKRDQYPLVRDQGLEVLNFQITMLLYYAIGIVLVFVVIGIPLLVVLGLYHVIITIIGAIKAYDGVAYRYPLTLRLL
jgi:uncharacterized Tic20 family protein